MKKHFTLVASSLLLASASFAQSPRTVLAEEFTQASCGPCAAQNPAYNALLRKNQDHVISLKYQTSWPGTDPMNTQNPTDVATRVSYYQVQGVPNVDVDGNYQNNVAPSQVTQSTINAEYPVLSPYSIGVTSALNTAQDSIFITMTVNCTQAVQGALMARVAIVENYIQFASAPGTNGEKEFQYNIMRKMLPDANGTTLATNWINGQTQTLTFAEKLPTYIYNKKQLGVVAFIQDDNNQNVKQAAYSTVLNADVTIADVLDATAAPSCSVNFIPKVKIINKGKDGLTSAIITPTIDGVVGTPVTWSGLLNTLESDLVTLPAVATTTAGAHTFSVNVSMPNAVTDQATQEDTWANKFYLYSAAQPYPYYQEFSAGGFPYTNFIVENVDNDPATWTKVTQGSAGGTGSGSAKIDFFNSPPGYVDNMYIPSIDLSTATATDSVKLDFKVAGAPYSATTPENDAIQVEVSIDCGASWDIVWAKSGTDLYTRPGQTTSYAPVAAHFRNETVNLDYYKGQAQVIVRFSAISNYGNNVYIDKINMHNSSTLALAKNNVIESIGIYPNPASTFATVNVTLANSEQVGVEVYNIIGEKVITVTPNRLTAGSNSIKLDTQALTNGVYLVNIVTAQGTTTQKLTVNK